MTGSVIVTTPHPLAVVDVLKGRQMMESMHVPTLALVSLTKLYAETKPLHPPLYSNFVLCSYRWKT
jgi:hypothetical protein